MESSCDETFRLYTGYTSYLVEENGATPPNEERGMNINFLCNGAEESHLVVGD